MQKVRSWEHAQVAAIHENTHLLRATALQIFFTPASALLPALLVTPAPKARAQLSATLQALCPGTVLFDRAKKVSEAKSVRSPLSVLSIFICIMLQLSLSVEY